jgi:hypothetical protein
MSWATLGSPVPVKTHTCVAWVFVGMGHLTRAVQVSMDTAMQPCEDWKVTSSLSLQRNLFITPDLEDFFSSPNTELCLSPMKIDGFPQSGFL